MTQAAESISMGDLVSAVQRRENSWSLLPLHAIISTVRPCFFSHGSMKEMYAFPSWLGQNSKQSKTHRILRELHLRMRLHSSCDKNQLCLQYIPSLARLLTDPLIKDTPDVYFYTHIVC